MLRNESSNKIIVEIAQPTESKPRLRILHAGDKFPLASKSHGKNIMYTLLGVDDQRRLVLENETDYEGIAAKTLTIQSFELKFGQKIDISQLPRYSEAMNVASALLRQGIEQGNRYNQVSQALGFTEEIIDGFLDGGNHAQYFSSYVDAELYRQNLNRVRPGLSLHIVQLSDYIWGVSNREFIFIDKYKDPIVCRALGNVQREYRSLLSEREKVIYIGTLVSDLCRDSLTENSSYLFGINTLSQVIEQKAAVCRHIVLLFHLLGKQVGLNCSVMKGFYNGKSSDMHGFHAWNQVRIDSVEYVADITLFIDRQSEILQPYNDLYGRKINGSFVPIR